MSSVTGLSVKRIAAHQQHSVSLVALSETAQQSALPLMEAMARESIGCGLSVVAVCLEQLLSSDIIRLPQVHLIDCRIQPAQITNCSAFTADGQRQLDIGKLESDICAEVEACAASAKAGVLVVIDDLEPLLAASRVSTLAMIRKLRSAVRQQQRGRVLVRYPRDTIDQDTAAHAPLVVSMLTSLADAVIDVHHADALETWMPGWYSDGQPRPFVTLSDSDSQRGLLRLEHKRPAGKMGYELASFEIGEQQRPAFAAITIAAAPKLPAGPQPAPLPLESTKMEQVPFSLELTEKQRQDRAQVELPYLAAQAGEIHYQLDAEDDWDEDDPDDDLEI
ncbi:Elongator complex protein [Coemansia sp. RSA 989]|nr:Elongator complex protein 5 [Coemansia mojavensis]KAJ1738166.1 Elongator complex protein [Coemansia sp. RSA 1086]KAJ1746986.1 Elongator complex protein [Coemansia sp. RSA 1821]KAJ1860571.1 Elongator complex protein [Coemansia sp. RSA 989]KAJ1870549.1 Elongator complex protein [Coemansia sp. RSA 990]KAJ2677397.1 Elongator complex protein [Coemansia sp. RSA 1085]